MSRYSKWIAPLFFLLGLSIVSFSFYQSAGVGLRKYEVMHLKSISREIREIVKAKQSDLEAKLARYALDPSLPQASSLAFNAGNLKPLNELLANVKSKAEVDLVAMGDPVTGNVIGHQKLGFKTPSFKESQSRAAFVPANNMPYLLVHAPVKLYGLTEGVLILGYAINRTVSQEIRKTTGSSVVFTLEEPESDAPEYLEIVSATGEESRVYLLADTGFVNEVRERSELAFMIALGLALLFLSYIFYRTNRGTVEFAKGYAQAADEVLHDLRGPSNALKELLPLLMESRDPELLLVAKSRVARIEAITDSLAERKRANDSLLPSSTKTRRENVEIRALIAAQMSESAIRYKKVSFELESKGTYVVAGDRTKLERVFSNLLSNAAESLADKDKKQVLVSIDSREGKVELSISDTGIGIPAQVLPRIFERGFTHGKKDGNGIGLAYVKEAIADLGGKISIASELGRGTTVRLQFPEIPSESEARNG
ncbi:MAG: HAMP domain-containing sensor histidine kinase [Bdellovibrionota bacterium]